MFIRCPPCDTRTRSQALASSSASQQGQWTAATKNEPALSGCVHIRQAAPPSTITQVLPFGATCLTTCCTWSPREHSLIWALKSDNEGCAHFATQSDVFHHNRCGEPFYCCTTYNGLLDRRRGSICCVPDDATNHTRPVPYASGTLELNYLHQELTLFEETSIPPTTYSSRWRFEGFLSAQEEERQEIGDARVLLLPVGAKSVVVWGLPQDVSGELPHEDPVAGIVWPTSLKCVTRAGARHRRTPGGLLLPR